MNISYIDESNAVVAVLNIAASFSTREVTDEAR